MKYNLSTLDKRKSKASDLSTTAEMLALLSLDPDPSVRELVAIHPRCPDEIKLALAQDACAGVREHVAQSHPPMEVLELLVQDHDTRVREVLAYSGSLPLSIALRLAQDKSIDVRFALCENCIDWPIAVEVMARDPDPEYFMLREAILLNDEVSPTLLANLADDKSPTIRKLVALHPNTPADIALKMAQDPDFYTRSPRKVQKSLA